MIPFLLIDDSHLALRVSNLTLVLLLFAAGYRWAHYTDFNPLRCGLNVMLLGVTMVAVALALGG